MTKFIDITGQKFNNLTVLERVSNTRKGAAQYRCICDCGNETVVRAYNLKSGAVKSCGCLRHNSQTVTHNMSHTKIYRIWAGIKNRCYNKRASAYKRYGGRGIKMCDEWLGSFEAFYEWATAKGYEEGLTIERIDNDGDYCPGNCKWIPLPEQALNRRRNRSISYTGETHNLAEWCKVLNLPYSRVHTRINKLGWTFEKAIETPCDVKKRHKREENKNGGIYK